MSQRRLFSPNIISSDAFLDMPPSSQALYFHLAMNADDDGFVNPKRIIKMLGSTDDELKILLSKRFLLPFESGVVVIKHWLIHNTIRKDRYSETMYLEEKKTLFIKANRAYTENWQPNGNQMVTEVKSSQVKLSEDKREILLIPESPKFEQFWLSYPKKELKKKTQEIWKRKKLDSQIDKILDFIGKAKLTDRWKKGFIRQPPAFLNNECWNDDLSSYNDKFKKTNLILK